MTFVITDKMRADLLQAMKDWSTPIDFADLVERGALRRLSANRYELLNSGKLPSYVTRQAIGVEMKRKRDGTQITILKFRSASAAERQSKAMRALLAKEARDRK